MVKDSLANLLIERGAMPRHAEKAEAMFRVDDGSDFCSVRDAICNLQTTCPDGAILGLVGERGVGKTQAAICGMYRWAERRQGPIRYIRFSELCMRFRDALKQGWEAKTLQDFEGHAKGLLVIDEMDKRADTEHERRTLATLIDGRYGWGRYTLLIGNDTKQGLEQAIGSTVVQRMNESGGIRVMVGPNYREAKR